MVCYRIYNKTDHVKKPYTPPGSPRGDPPWGPSLGFPEIADKDCPPCVPNTDECFASWDKIDVRYSIVWQYTYLIDLQMVAHLILSEP